MIEHGANVNYKDKNGVTALMQAKSLTVAKLLIDCGADVNAVDLSGRSVLMWAIFNKNDTATI
jgi:ankyrin repeat protein